MTWPLAVLEAETIGFWLYNWAGYPQKFPIVGKLVPNPTVEHAESAAIEVFLAVVWTFPFDFGNGIVSKEP